MRFRRLLINKVCLGIALGLGLCYAAWEGNAYTSTDEFCASCHVHPEASRSWRRSTHYDNDSGVYVRCVQCHLPPEGFHYLTEKIRVGVRDAWGKLFKDVDAIDWEERSRLEHARTFTYKEACVHCHQNLYPLGLTEEGDEAHFHYSEHERELRCINCHLHVGHDSRKAKKAARLTLTANSEPAEIFTKPAQVTRFEDYEETVPSSSVKFAMVALPGGEFTLGSPESESYRDDDEGPTRQVRLRRFWMARTEVTWDEYLAFYAQTASEGRTDTQALTAIPEGVDGISGATPPYGDPDQGWGKGSRPAITMTHHAAMTYCRWLSLVTGKTYRLPTEAEWEYACRGGDQQPYHFEGDPDDFSERSTWNRWFGADREPIETYVVYAGNSENRSQPSSAVEANPFGLVNMSGNVNEYCLDWYAADAYAGHAAGQVVEDPRGPEEGTEHVIRGGSFQSDAADVRSAARDHTRHDQWMMTDPQIPKSRWWYSDCITIGFRVVCECDLP